LLARNAPYNSKRTTSTGVWICARRTPSGSPGRLPAGHCTTISGKRGQNGKSGHDRSLPDTWRWACPLMMTLYGAPPAAFRLAEPSFLRYTLFGHHAAFLEKICTHLSCKDLSGEVKVGVRMPKKVAPESIPSRSRGRSWFAKVSRHTS
jgi:hypothetical protein